MAVVDKPFEQRRDLLWLALDGAAGHVAVVGAPQSGKSTALRTLICALALTHTPAEVQVYCLDFGGGGLAALRDLPHVGGVAGRRRPDRRPAHRRRDRHPAGRPGAPLRRAGRRVDGRVPAAPSGARDGRSAGHRPVRRRVPGGRRLGHAARRVRRPGAARHRPGHPGPVVRGPRGRHRGCAGWTSARRSGTCSAPGWSCASATRPTRWWPGGRPRTCRSSPAAGVTAEGLHFLTALPQLGAAGGDTADLVKAVADGVGRAAGAPGAAAPAGAAVRRAGPAPRRPGCALPIGIAEADLRPVLLDFATEPHFVVFGDAECGKSSFLRALATSIITRFTPGAGPGHPRRLPAQPARRRSRRRHLIGYGTAAAHTADLVESAAGYLERRGCPARTSPRSSCATGPGGPGRSCSCWSTTTTWWRPGRRTRCARWRSTCRRPATSGCTWCWPAGPAARAGPCTSRSCSACGSCPRAGLVMSGSPDEGALVGPVRPGPLPPGRGRLVTRREGVRLVQLAQLPPH